MHRPTRLSFLLSCCYFSCCVAFVVIQQRPIHTPTAPLPVVPLGTPRPVSFSSSLAAITPTTESIQTIQLVISQENYGLAVVCLGEALWSFAQSPSLSNVKVVVPAIVATLVLVAVSGPMMTSASDSLDSIGTGLWIATAVSVGLCGSYLLRLAAPYSESPKEAAAAGLLIALAGLASFGQNLIVNGFVILPSLPSIELPSVELPF